jgi:hypothetical protein
MRKLTAGLAILASTAGGALAGCSSAASSSQPTGTVSATVSAASAAASSAKPAASGLGGVSSGAGLARWVVDGTLTQGKPAQPMAGIVTFRDKGTGKSTSVSVGNSGQFIVGLVAGSYTATPVAPAKGDGNCGPIIAVTVKAGQQTKVTLSCFS